jgi:hypothetical protein
MGRVKADWATRSVEFAKRRGISPALVVLQVAAGACLICSRTGIRVKRDGGKMTKLFVAAMLCLLFCTAGVIGGEKSVFDYTLSTIDGQPAPLSAYKGKVVMLVNVASRCGFAAIHGARSDL